MDLNKKYDEILNRIQSGQFNKVEEDLISILNIDSNNDKFHFLLGLFYGILKKNKKAEHHFNEVLKINPKHFVAIYNLGFFLKEKGKQNEALSKFKEALKIEPNYIDALLGIGKIYEEKKNYIEAKKYYELSLNLNKNHKLTNQFYGALLIRMNKMKEGQDYLYRSIGVIRFSKKGIEII